ncbi:hypothetical protein [Herbaspirillum sp. SJZ107]|uniref:hypothetical protein n=1 Tax=Herbaspirillum sp. SJZ107 TaxID=2572881 RepID=UPI00114E736F|nr:hypothetical protein [Herbaspirillum sp. SJZ107]TQK11731.1 hypothetical protein FBX97_1680 [Herbaspirillum sp. SJZ107]
MIDRSARRRISLFAAAGALAIAGWAAQAPQETVRKAPLPSTEPECVARGGEWIFAGPQNIVKYCALSTNDGGKSCKTSSQCQSECVERETGNVCADTHSGCFAPTGRGTATQCVN